MSIKKLNIESLNTGIISLNHWKGIYEQILDSIESSKEILEKNESSSIEGTLDVLEDLRKSMERRSEEVEKKHKEVKKYKERLTSTKVTPIVESSSIFIDNADVLKRKLKQIKEDINDNKVISLNKANKMAISWGIEDKEKDELKSYIDERNNFLENISSSIEDRYKEMSQEISNAIVEVKKLEALEELDVNFSLAHYEKVKRMIKLTVDITKGFVKYKIKLKDLMRETAHFILPIAGLVPAVGTIPDAIDTGLYLVELDFKNASLSGLSMVPALGASIAATRASKTTKAITNGMEFASDTFKSFKAYQKGEEAFVESIKISDKSAEVIEKIDKIYDTAKKLDLGIEAFDVADSYIELYLDIVDGSVKEIPADVLKALLEKYDLAINVGEM